MASRLKYIDGYITEDNLASVANKFAENGWELVSFTKAYDCLPEILFCIFKKMVEVPKKGCR